jgi:hypothetical protein
MDSILQLKAESRVLFLRPTFLVNKQHLGTQAYMDECEQQILHEFRHATASSLIMASDSSATASSETVKSPPLASQSTSSQPIPSNPMEALQR